MANAKYAKGKEKILRGEIDWADDTIKAVLCTDSYSENLSTDEFLSDIPGGARVATETLSSKTDTAGAADAADTVHSSVAGGSTVTKIAIYKDTGVEATSPLLIFLDDAVSGLPAVTNGLDITLQWPAGGIFEV